MIDLKDLRENQERYDLGFAKKRVKVNIQELLSADKKYRDKLMEVEKLRASRNEMSKSIGLKGGVNSMNPEAKGMFFRPMKIMSEKLKQEEAELNKLFDQLTLLTARVPNLPDDSVPEGRDDQDNEVVRMVGQPPSFDFEPKDHMALGESLDLIDMETAAQTSGARFYYLKNEAVLLEFALVQWLFKKFVQNGFTPVTVPMLVKEEMMFATGFFPADKNEIYHVNPKTDATPDGDDLFLVGTSEVALAGLHMFKAVPGEKLPRRYIGFSSCFRREAGSYGKDTKGILRVHQFDKMEMFSFCHPAESRKEHEFLLSMEESILTELKLPYRVVNICGGDLGAPAAKKYDCEVWIPSQGKYRELTSCSNCTDFQARRGNIRYKDEHGTHLLHTLNGTAMASTRTLIAILENYQQKDGSVKIPEVLQSYMGGLNTIGAKQ